MECLGNSVRCLSCNARKMFNKRCLRAVTRPLDWKLHWLCCQVRCSGLRGNLIFQRHKRQRHIHICGRASREKKCREKK